MKVLLGVTGSAGTTEINEFISAFQAAGYEVKVVATKNAMYFLRGKFPLAVEFWGDKTEWVGNAYKVNQSVSHIELGNWAEVLVVAPLSANTLAKFANGLCDNLLTNIFRSWNFNKPVVFAPEMNVWMWQNVFTTIHLTTLAQFQRGNGKKTIEVIQPISCTQGDALHYLMPDGRYIVGVLRALETK